MLKKMHCSFNLAGFQSRIRSIDVELRAERQPGKEAAAAAVEKSVNAKWHKGSHVSNNRHGVWDLQWAEVIQTQPKANKTEKTQVLLRSIC